MLLALAAALALQTAPADTPRAAADAYLDPAARTLVAQARARRARVERQIDAYQATAKERSYAGLRTLGRNRTLARQEVAARIHWRRDAQGRVEVLGGREAVPVARGGVRLPGDIRSEAVGLAFDPDELQLSLPGFDRDPGDRDADGLVDPLGPGSEAHYRFRSGESTAIRLPDGRTIRIRELEVIPRRSDWRLVRGSLWIDSDSHGVVRTVFRLARPFELSRDFREVDDDGDELPAPVRALGRVGADVHFATTEYALWEGRWWLPRLVSVEATAEVGVLGKVPVRFERSYSAYQVTARPAEQVEVLPAPTAARDTAASRCRGEREAGLVCRCSHGRCRQWRVELPADTAALLASRELPPPLTEGAETLITGEEVAELARVLDPRLDRLGDYPFSVRWRAADLDLLRYNRVEGLSVGARVEVERGPLRLDGTARLGTADREPEAEVGVVGQTVAARYRLAGYRRLAPFDPSLRALDLGGSLSALLLGRDEADYLRATGAELTGRPVRMGRWDYRWRLFAEHQHPVSRRTGVSLARAWSDAPVFPEVRPAERADQAGASLRLATGRGDDPLALRWEAGLGVELSTGTFTFARPSASAGVGFPLAGGLVGALEGAAGASAGSVPVQGLWYLGGPASVRGYRVAAVRGEAFWRARAGVATAGPAARVGTFADAGWAGARDAWMANPTLLSAGVGGSLLDGVLRVDVARALRGDEGWRVDLSLHGTL